FLYQRGAPVTQPVTVYVVPVAIDVGLDIALVQAHDGGPDGAKLATPDYLTLDARDAASLVGTHVHVVGHPESRIKKWTEGTVFTTDGEWILADAYSLPGNSGSPVLDDHGHMVGILHRGPESQDMITARGVNEYMLGSAAAPIVAALDEPLPAGVVSVRAPTTDADLVAHAIVFRNAHVGAATVDGMTRNVLDALGDACDKALARTDFTSPDDFTAAVAPCTEGYLWIECRSDATPDFASCPADTGAWGSRFASVNDRSVALNGQLLPSML